MLYLMFMVYLMLFAISCQIAHLEQNLAALDVVLSEADLKTIDDLFPVEEVVGDR